MTAVSIPVSLVTADCRTCLYRHMFSLQSDGFWHGQSCGHIARWRDLLNPEEVKP